ncbi:hypothetical protein [Aureibacillus halotolerans]|uniref:Uncharacterized protein n=1 Tax=Aureibacillus halotolerans TaxID=1508390 RepID=A0A4R6U7Q4_9BACI|nr:hypothetical protein [Aureibacillus halotolerans]TDQ40779.1 hypothetical protein EV213_105125 [Aureibacillus halotolerans]
MIGLFNWVYFRTLVLNVLEVSSINPWSWKIIDNVSFIVFGIGWLLVVLCSQYMYTKALKQSNVLNVFCVFTGYQFFLLFLCSAVSMVINSGDMSLLRWFIWGGEGVAGVVCFFIGYTRSKPSAMENHTKKGDAL